MNHRRLPRPVKQLLRFAPDRAYIQLYYFRKFHSFADLRNPVTYNEKLQWLKLNYRIPTDAKLVDKYEVKEIVARQIGAEHVIPTLAVYDSADEIDFDALPDAFVLKCTHDSGSATVIKDKSLVDREEIRRRLRQALSRNFYEISREPHYRDLTPRIIAEPYLEDTARGQLVDYKFFCFDGDVKAMFISSDRASGITKFDYFDADFTPLDCQRSGPTSGVRPERPQRFDEMIAIARTLSQGHPHVRVDLYEVDGRVYFGELTFYPCSGIEPFTPSAWDAAWGEWLTLPAPQLGQHRKAAALPASGKEFTKRVKRLLRFVPDRAYIQMQYFRKFHSFADLRNPVTYNEKLQWLKLNYRIPTDAKLVDKYEVKEIVAREIGAEHVIPTLAVYDSADEIDFDALPDAFVLKCTHDSGSTVLVEDKSLIDREKIGENLRQALSQNHYQYGREPHYRDLTPRIIAEPYLENTTQGQLHDYKFFCFDGKVKAMYVVSDRTLGEMKSDFFDANFTPIELRWSDPTSDVRPERPQRYDEMLAIAHALSQGRPHVRVDLYEVNGQVYFGEFTFFPCSGFEPLVPASWDATWGEWLTLPAPRTS